MCAIVSRMVRSSLEKSRAAFITMPCPASRRMPSDSATQWLTTVPMLRVSSRLERSIGSISDAMIAAPAERGRTPTARVAEESLERAHMATWLLRWSFWVIPPPTVH